MPKRKIVSIWRKLGDYEKVEALSRHDFPDGRCGKCRLPVFEHGLLKLSVYVEPLILCPGAIIIEKNGEIGSVNSACYRPAFIEQIN